MGRRRARPAERRSLTRVRRSEGPLLGAALAQRRHRAVRRRSGGRATCFPMEL